MENTQLKLFYVPTVGEETCRKIRERIGNYSQGHDGSVVTIEIPKIKHLI
jgi:hypothetical protein